MAATSVIYGLLQVILWHHDTAREKMSGWNWCRHITDFFQYIHALSQGGIIISIYDISLPHFLFWKKHCKLKECVPAIPLLNRKRAIHWMDGCSWNCGLTQYLWKKEWLQVLASKKRSTLENENTRSLQVASWNTDRQCHSNVWLQVLLWIYNTFKWKYLSNTCIYAMHGCKWSSENTVSIEEWMAATTSVK